MGAETEEQAEQMAKAVVRSPLVKCRRFRHRRQLGAGAVRHRLFRGALSIPRTWRCSFLSTGRRTAGVRRGGKGVAFDEARGQAGPVGGRGGHPGDPARAAAPPATCWGCDLTYDYVKINGDYRS